MKLVIKYFLLLAIFCLPVFPQKLTDIIKPINLNAGMRDSVLISDLFYSEKYDIKFLYNPFIQINFNKSNGYLYLTSQKDFAGLSLIDFIINKDTLSIPVISKIKKDYAFTFKPEKKVTSITLFGSFNGWNRQNLPMEYDSKASTYKISVQLDPGLYEYKFSVDGEEVNDPSNSETKPNGMGGFNSVIIIPENIHKSYLHLLERKETNNTVSFSFYYEDDNQNANLNKNDLIVLLDNKKVSENFISIEGRRINLSLSKTYLDNHKILRVAVNKSGKASNIQTIFVSEKIFENGDFPLQDMIVYSLMIDRFNDGDTTNSIPVIHPELTKQANYQGGDLQGIINKINEGYFDSLGINTLWLSPVIDNTDSAYQEYPAPHRYYTGYHGYWPVNPTKVEERFGNIKLLKQLISTAHSHRIKVLLDYIANHIHIEHPFWKEHRDWFGNLELSDGRKNLRLWDEYRLTTWFEPYMPKFDYINSKEALEAMTDNAIWWLKETGADGFRHDAVKHVPNQFWRLLTRKIKTKFPELKYQIGETFGSYELINSYVNNGQLDAQFNFNLYDNALRTFIDSTSSFKNLDLEMKKSFSVFGMNNLMGNVMDSHDKVRFMAFADGDISLNEGNIDEIGWSRQPQVDNESSYKKLKLYLAYLLTIPGIPVIYYGDEFGMTGANDPDNRRMMRFGSQLNKLEKETLSDVSRMIHLRKENSALRNGDFQTLIADENIYAYMRSDLPAGQAGFNERILVVINKNKSEKAVEIELPQIYNLELAEDLIKGNVINLNENEISLEVPAFSFCILKLK